MKNPVIIIDNPVTEANALNSGMDKETIFQWYDEGYNQVELVDENYIKNLNIGERIHFILSTPDKDMISLGLAASLLNLPESKVTRMYLRAKEEVEEYGVKILKPIDIFEKDDGTITLDDQVLRMKTSTQTFFSPVAILLMAMMDQKSVVTKAIADQAMELGQTRLCKEARIAKANKKEDRLMMADKQVKWIIKRLEEGMTNEEYCIEATKFAKLFLKGNLCMLRAGTTIN